MRELATPGYAGGATPARGRKSRVLLGLLSGGLILLLFGIQLYQWQQNSVLREQVERSYETRVHLDRVLSLHQDIETGQRGFLLTGNESFLEPYTAARAGLEDAFNELERGISDPRSRRTMGALRFASNDKVAFSEQMIDLKREGNSQQATLLVSSGHGHQVMNRIRGLIGQLRDAEQAELRRLLQARSEIRWWAQPLSLTLQLVLLLMLGAAYIAYLAQVRRLERSSIAAQDLSARQVAIFEAATDAMMVVNDSGFVETANPAACRLFGRETAEIVGIPVASLFRGGTIYVGGFNDRRTEPRAERSSQQVEGLCADGSTFDAEVSASVVQLADRLLTLLLVRDATERNRVERMKTQFVSTVSHELRTPLTSIRGAIALLDHTIGAALEPKPRQLLTMAKTNSERLSKLIDDILDVEKMGSRDLQFHFDTIDLRDAVTRAAEDNRTFAADRGVRLNAVVPDRPIMVRGDESRLIQALANLLSNAAKFTPRDGVVNIFAEARDGWARISVADQGPGVPVEFRPHLFDRFSQARDSQQSSNAGTGLGLAITKSIVERHKGRIGFETSVGEGTLFWIELALATGDEDGD